MNLLRPPKETRRPHVVIVGSSNTDLVLDCPRLPQPGETLLGGEFHRFAGGKGANQAVAAARAGAKVTFVGARGADEFGRSAAALLKREGISVRHFMEKPDATSGVALILLGGRSRENIIGVSRSANDLLSPSDIEAAERAFRSADVVLAQLETPVATVQKAAELAAINRAPFILNPAPARSIPASLFRLIHTLTPNEHEVCLLAREKNVEKAAQKLLARGAQRVVVTLGARGAMLVDKAGVQFFKAPRVKPVDTVGAGDCFSAWLAVGVAEGRDMGSALRNAIAASALAVTRAGAQAGMPNRVEIIDGVGRLERPTREV